MPRAPKHCGRHGCTKVVQGVKHCPTHTAELQQRANTTSRGYGWKHQKRRAADAPVVTAGRATCWRCGLPIAPGAEWHEGHDDNDRSVYRGPEHVRCNTSTASRRGT
jgi:hypothetical protein